MLTIEQMVPLESCQLLPPDSCGVTGPHYQTRWAIDGRPPGLHGNNEVGSVKRMLVVISDPGGCWSRAPTACTEPHTPLIIIVLGQFSAALAGEVNKALVRGVHRPGPQPPIQKHQGSGTHMLRVQNQAK
jgi:hypothetical protein